MKKGWIITSLVLSLLALTSCTGVPDAAMGSLPETTNNSINTYTPDQGSLDFSILDTDDKDSESSDDGILSNFEADTLQGDVVNSDIFNDYDITMVNIWATFCNPCISEMPELGELAAELEDDKVQIIGIISDAIDYNLNLNDDVVDTANEIVAITGADYIHLIPNESLAGALVLSDYVPTTFFVDSEGNMVGDIYTGAKDKDTWLNIINDTLDSIR